MNKMIEEIKELGENHKEWGYIIITPLIFIIILCKYYKCTV